MSGIQETPLWIVIILLTVALLGASTTATLAVAAPNGTLVTFAGEDDPTTRPTTTRDLRSPQEILVCLVCVFALIAGTLVLVGSAVKQPGVITVVPLSENAAEGDYIRTVTDQLMMLGFTTKLDFTVPELPHEGVFRLMSTRGGEHTVLLAQIKAGSGFSVNRQYVNYMEYQTILDDGGKINTNNTPMKGPFVEPPYLLSTSHPRVLDPRELFDIHRVDIATLRTQRGGRIKPQNTDEFEREFPSEWRKINDFQVSRGLLRRSKDGDSYKGTLRLVLRHLAPRVENNDDAVRTFGAALAGAGVMAAALWAMPVLVEEFGLQNNTTAGNELEAAVILLIALAAGYGTGTGGYLLGLFCYLPSIIILVSGPLGYFVPTILAANTGQLGEKLRNLSVGRGLPWYKQLSPEIYISIGMLILAAI